MNHSKHLLSLVPETESCSTCISFRAEVADDVPKEWINPRLLRKGVRAATRLVANERLRLIRQSLRDLAFRVAPPRPRGSAAAESGMLRV